MYAFASALPENSAPPPGLQRHRREVENIVASFEALDLRHCERLSALAGAIAGAAARRHLGGTEQLLARLSEMSRPGLGTYPAPPASHSEAPRRERIAEAQLVLERGLARLSNRLEAERVGAREAALIETVVLSRLLGAHRPGAIRRALARVQDALATRAFRPGDLIIVETPSM